MEDIYNRNYRRFKYFEYVDVQFLPSSIYKEVVRKAEERKNNEILYMYPMIIKNYRVQSYRLKRYGNCTKVFNGSLILLSPFQGFQ